MTTSRTVTFEYAEPPSEVAVLLQDPVFLRYRSEAAGERNVDVSVQPEQDGVRVTVSRDKTMDVPAFARIAVGNASRAVESTLWKQDGERFTAEYTIDVSGLPVKVQGRSTLAPSAKGCKYSSTFESTARIPLIGGRIENLMADRLVEQLLANAERNAAALVRDSERGARSFIDGLREKSGQSASKG